MVLIKKHDLEKKFLLNLKQLCDSMTFSCDVDFISTRI